MRARYWPSTGCESSTEPRKTKRATLVKRPTIADIAREAGVSKGAVSYALNGQPGVSDATRDRILEIAAELRFTPARGSRAAAGPRAVPGSRAAAAGLVLCRPPRILGVEPFFM